MRSCWCVRKTFSSWIASTRSWRGCPCAIRACSQSCRQLTVRIVSLTSPWSRGTWKSFGFRTVLGKWAVTAPVMAQACFRASFADRIVLCCHLHWAFHNSLQLSWTTEWFSVCVACCFPLVVSQCGCVNLVSVQRAKLCFYGRGLHFTDILLLILLQFDGC